MRHSVFPHLVQERISDNCCVSTANEGEFVIVYPSIHTQIQTVHSQKIGHFDECKDLSSLFGSFVVPKTVEVVSSVQSRTVM